MDVKHEQTNTKVLKVSRFLPLAGAIVSVLAWSGLLMVCIGNRKLPPFPSLPASL